MTVISHLKYKNLDKKIDKKSYYGAFLLILDTRQKLKYAKVDGDN